MSRLFWILVVLFVVLVAVVIFDAVARGADAASPDLLVAPGRVNQYDAFRVTVVATPNTSFALQVYGANSFYLDLSNATDGKGLWNAQEQAWYPFGSYDFILHVGNATVRQTLDVVCDAQCVNAAIQQNGQQQAAILAGFLVSFGTYLIIAVIAFEAPRDILFFRDRAKRAKDMGSFTDRETASAFWVRLRGFIQPGDQVADPRNVQNPRIASDQDRRRIMEQIHEATSHKYLEWSPGHIKDLDRLMAKLHGAWSRQTTTQPEAVPSARSYVEPVLEPAKEAPSIPDGIYRSPPIERAPSSGGDPLPIVSSHYSGRNVPRRTDDMDKMDDWIGRQRVRVLRERIVGWALVVGGIALLFMVVLVVLAYAGIYVDALRPLWTSWPPDVVKVVVGGTIGVVLVTYSVTKAVFRARHPA